MRKKRVRIDGMVTAKKVTVQRRVRRAKEDRYHGNEVMDVAGLE